MCVTVVCLLDSDEKYKYYRQKWNLVSFTKRPIAAPASIGTILIFSLSIVINGGLIASSNNVISQVNQQDKISPSANKITIHLNSKVCPIHRYKL